MKLFNKPLIATIKKNVNHQGIGGKKIIIERECFVLELEPTIALYNFLKRKELKTSDDFYIYYGHVKGLGYFVAKDEVENLRVATEREIRKFR